jgi:hypothetical protein
VRLALTLALVITATVTANQPMESSWGWSTGEPVGSIAPFDRSVIGMQGSECLGFVIARGVVSQADHEAAEGFANIGDNFGLSMRPQSPLYQRVLELRGKPVEVVLRPLPERTLETIR